MEVIELIERAKNGDIESMEDILQFFKPKVNAICREYFLIGADFDDILQEGMIGLYKAVQNYDKQKNDNFARFASMCIHRQIQSAVKIANAKKNLPLNDYFSINEEGAIESDGERTAQILLVTKDRIVEKISLQKEKNSDIINQIKNLLNQEQYKILILYLNGYSYGENLEAGLDVSMEVSDSMLKTQMIAAFEEELVKLYFDTHREMAEANDLISRQQQEEYERYRDIADGIIIL